MSPWTFRPSCTKPCAVRASAVSSCWAASPIAAAVAVVAVGTLTRVRAADQLKTWTAAQAVPAVQVLQPSGQAGAQQLMLPGTVQAFYNAPIYARVNGYVKAWYRDIGDHVRAGEVLAVIDTPELDQQLAQAKANLASAVAAQQLAQTTANRWTRLLADDAVSKQEQEEKTGDLLSQDRRGQGRPGPGRPVRGRDLVQAPRRAVRRRGDRAQDRRRRPDQRGRVRVRLRAVRRRRRAQAAHLRAGAPELFGGSSSPA